MLSRHILLVWLSIYSTTSDIIYNVASMFSGQDHVAGTRMNPVRKSRINSTRKPPQEDWMKISVDTFRSRSKGSTSLGYVMR